MRFTATLICLILLVSACEDDPIIGPGGEDDTGGGSYGVIHFNTRPDVRNDAGAANTTATIDSVRNLPDDPAGASSEIFIPDNPKRF